MNKALTNVVAIASVVALAGCAATGENLQANVYKAGQVNQTQEAKTVQILAVLPAKIEVDNAEQKKAAQVGGAILGAILGAAAGGASKNNPGAATAGGAVAGAAVGGAAGSLVKDKVLVDGVSLTYTFKGKTLNSAQVGKTCEFAPGMAVMVSTSPTETRIQPNKECPKEK
jgi:outer membrane lipoprotein SlyB